jgi:vancomycin resistance protein YoaR
MRRLTTRSGILAAGALSAVLVVGATVGLRSAGDHSRTARGTSIAGLQAGELDRAALLSLMQEAVAQAPSAVRVVLGNKTVTVPLRDVGLTVDVRATVERALSASSSGSRFGLFGGGRGKSVVPVLMTDVSRLKALVARLAKVGNVPESHGQLAYAGGELTAVMPQSGQGVAADLIAERLQAAIQMLPTPARVTVPVTTTAAHVTSDQFGRVADRARAQIRVGTIVASGTRRTTVEGAALAPFLTVTSEGSAAGHPIALGLAASVRAGLASEVAAALSADAVEPKVEAPPASALLTTQGSVTWRPRPIATRLVTAGRPGQRVTPDAVLAALTSGLRQPEPQSPVVLLADAIAPHSSDASVRSVNALLGTFTTPYACCQPRVTNIRLIARTVDGTLIAPGQSFSLNDIVGRRTKAKGYVEAPFILDGELSSDVGGGVSQFATTTLNAAFFAGLRLDRHQPHSFYISRYPAGREATVNYPSIDLRWTNTTSAPVLVRASTTATSLTVALYGKGDGRTVQAVSGPRKPVAGRNFRIVVSRVLTVPGRATARETFTTTYNKPPKGE